MPIFFQQDIDNSTRLAIWKIEEEEAFFLQNVGLQRTITHPHKRLQHLAGRFLLQYLFPHFPLDLIRIADTRKPFLEDEAFHFSISHCGDFAGVIVSQKERVGIDIEIPTPKVEKIKMKFLGREELAMGEGKEEAVHISGQGGPFKVPLNPYRLTLLWCCKEAVYKWWSYGKVTFSEQIRLQPFRLQPAGTVRAQFISGRAHDLLLQYTLFEGLCLAWVKTGL